MIFVSILARAVLAAVAVAIVSQRARAGGPETCPGLVVLDGDSGHPVAPCAVAVVDATGKTAISSTRSVGRASQRELTLSRPPRAGDRVYVYCRGYDIASAVYVASDRPEAKAPTALVELKKSMRHVTVTVDEHLRGQPVRISIGVRYKIGKLPERLGVDFTQTFRFSASQPRVRIPIPRDCPVICRAKPLDGKRAVIWPEHHWIADSDDPAIEFRAEPVRTVRVQTPPELGTNVSATVIPRYGTPPRSMAPARAEAILYHLFGLSIGPSTYRPARGTIALSGIPRIPVRVAFSVGGRDALVQLDGEVQALDFAKAPIPAPSEIGVPSIAGQTVRKNTVVVAGRVDLTTLLRLSKELRRRYPTLSAVVTRPDERLLLAASETLTVWHPKVGVAYAERMVDGGVAEAALCTGACKVTWIPRPGYRLRIATFPWWHGTREKYFSSPDERLWVEFDGAAGEALLQGLATGEYLCVLELVSEKHTWRGFRRFTLVAGDKTKLVELDAKK